MRNPKWHQDEIILALDLYFRLEPGQIHARNPDIIELSKVLNQLPIHDSKPDEEKFRNPNGVGLKLSNFLALDPNYEGTGMQAHSKLDQELFNKYSNNRELLKRLARNIISTTSDFELRDQLKHIDLEDEEVQEGEVIYKLHRYRERNSRINKKKKDLTLTRYGSLECEVCGFDFFKIYGERGKGYIECHHRVPLSNLDPGTKTTLDDLALVCANCHRILHRKTDDMSIDTLKSTLTKS
ncbi:MAG: hypothetical protein DHS20C17_18670 [Cyclobacteriaceae bacterium]|nr:MAG: hypothetical protein DHS20C17_18670 [Cyclobacteriaceae bacterium]